MSRKNKNVPKSNWWTIYLELKEIYMTAFTWEGLPPSINVRYLEMALMTTGRVCYFIDDAIGLPLMLKAMNGGRLDVYGEPTKVNVYGVNGYHNFINVDSPMMKGDGVLIYDNYIRKTPLVRLQDYAKRIYEMERTIDINVRHQKTPRIPVTDKDSLLSFETFFRKVDEGDDTIVVDSGMFDGKSSISLILSPAPYVADRIQELKKNLWNEVLSYIGILNNNSEKGERLVADEIKASNGLALSKRNSRLQTREIAIKQINEKFGTDIKIEVNSDLLDEIMESQGINDEPYEGGEDND